MDVEPLSRRQMLQPSRRRRKVVVIGGATATGKSLFAVELAKRVGGEIISADAVQVYRMIDIGSAKLSLAERQGIAHHLIDICDLTQAFNAFEFYKRATVCIEEIGARGHLPIVVGGTGFYLRTLLYGPPQTPPSSHKVRSLLEQDLDKFGVEFLYERLCRYDPAYGARLTMRDRHKIVRGLEIVALTGEKVSSFSSIGHQALASFYDFRCWQLDYPRDILYPRIEMRCDAMIAQGLLTEIAQLEHQGLRANNQISRAIGYRQGLRLLDQLQLLDGKLDDRGHSLEGRLSQPYASHIWEEFVQSFKQASRQYAKRQQTFFRKERLFHVIALDQAGDETAFEKVYRDSQV